MNKKSCIKCECNFYTDGTPKSCTTCSEDLRFLSIEKRLYNTEQAVTNLKIDVEANKSEKKIVKQLVRDVEELEDRVDNIDVFSKKMLQNYDNPDSSAANSRIPSNTRPKEQNKSNGNLSNISGISLISKPATLENSRIKDRSANSSQRLEKDIFRGVNSSLHEQNEPKSVYIEEFMRGNNDTSSPIPLDRTANRSIESNTYRGNMSLTAFKEYINSLWEDYKRNNPVHGPITEEDYLWEPCTMDEYLDYGWEQHQEFLKLPKEKQDKKRREQRQRQFAPMLYQSRRLYVESDPNVGRLRNWVDDWNDKMWEEHVHEMNNNIKKQKRRDSSESSSSDEDFLKNIVMKDKHFETETETSIVIPNNYIEDYLDRKFMEYKHNLKKEKLDEDTAGTVPDSSSDSTEFLENIMKDKTFENRNVEALNDTTSSDDIEEFKQNVVMKSKVFDNSKLNSTAEFEFLESIY